jgi:hypothetical protein
MNALKHIAFCLALVLPGCAFFAGGSNSPAAKLTTPEQVQKDITITASIAKPYLNASVVADITAIKGAALSLANGTLPIAQFQALIAAHLPTKDAPALSLALAAASAVFAEAYTTYGLANSQFTAYCNALSTGLTAAGF